MKYINQIVVLGIIVSILSCKQNTPVNTVTKGNINELKENKQVSKDTTPVNPYPGNDSPSDEAPSVIPESGRSNMAVEFDDKKEHAVGIFRMPDELSWRELIAKMDYAPDKEVNKSFVYNAKAKWWVSRDIKGNVTSRKLLVYKKKDKTGEWFFAFNKNKEVYFWK